MARYFFHVDNGEFVPDRNGTELPDLDAVRKEAVRAAGKMINEAQESFWEHMSPWNMHVTDAEARLLFTLQFGVKVPSGETLYMPRVQAEEGSSGPKPDVPVETPLGHVA